MFVQGYMCITRDSTVHIWDDQFRKAMLLDMSTGPPPGMHVLPFTATPDSEGPLNPGATAHNVIARQNLSRYTSKVAAQQMQAKQVRTMPANKSHPRLTARVSHCSATRSGDWATENEVRQSLDSWRPVKSAGRRLCPAW